jgi:hypothetical protein
MDETDGAVEDAFAFSGVGSSRRKAAKNRGLGGFPQGKRCLSPAFFRPAQLLNSPAVRRILS